MNKKIKIFAPIAVVGVATLALFSSVNLASKKEESIDYSKSEIKLMSNELNLNIPDGVNITEDDCAGYNISTSMVFTKHIDKKKAINLLKPYMLFLDGNPCNEDYSLVTNINSTNISFQITYPDGRTSNIYTSFKEIDAIDGVEFASATPLSFRRHAVICDKSTVGSGADVNKFVLDALHQNLVTITDPVYDLKYNDALNPNNNIWSKSVLRAGNGKYYNVMGTVRLLDGICADGYKGTSNNTDTYQEKVEVNPENPEATESGIDDLIEHIENFKENNSDGMKIATAIISSVLGIALIYVIYLIIRKLWRSLKR